MAADVNEIRRALPWRRRISVVGDTKRDVRVRQQAEGARRVPAGMPEFERISPRRTQHLEEGRKAVVVHFELWRQLKQHRPGLRPQQ